MRLFDNRANATASAKPMQRHAASVAYKSNQQRLLSLISSVRKRDGAVRDYLSMTRTT
jgi:hypothetical protein